MILLELPPSYYKSIRHLIEENSTGKIMNITASHEASRLTSTLNVCVVGGYTCTCAPRTYKDGAYYWVKLKKEFFDADDDMRWIPARYIHAYGEFDMGTEWGEVHLRNLEEIGEEIKRDHKK